MSLIEENTCEKTEGDPLRRHSRISGRVEVSIFHDTTDIGQQLTYVLACRHQRTGLRGAATREAQGEVRFRGQPRVCPAVLEETALLPNGVYITELPLRPMRNGELR